MNKLFRSPYALIFFGVVVSAVGMVIYWQFYRETPPQYRLQAVEKGDLSQTVSASGTINPVTMVSVGTQVSGMVKKLYVDFNSKVKQGQILLELDDALLAAQQQQSAANVQIAEASLELATANEARMKGLYAQEFVSRQEWDNAIQAKKSAAAQLKLAQAIVQKDRVNLAYTVIRSPVSGVVVDRSVDVGQTVAASLQTPTLFKIAQDLARMQINANFAEADIGTVEAGQKVSFTVDAFPNRNFQGAITQVRNAPKTTANVVTYDTIISVENSDLKLRPGMTANVAIVVARRDSVLRVPNAALRVRLPEGLVAAVAKTEPAKQTATSGTAATAPAVAPSGGQGGGNRQGGRGGMLANATPEQQQAMREIMAEVGYTRGSGGPPSPEQREQIRKLMIERGLTPAEPTVRPGEVTFTSRTVYRLPGGKKTAAPEAVTVKVGITDGLASEIAEGLQEGDVIVTSVTVAGAKPAGAPTSNPFGGGRRF